MLYSLPIFCTSNYYYYFTDSLWKIRYSWVYLPSVPSPEMIKQNDNLKYEVFVTDQVSLCRRLFTSPRFYVVFLVVQVAIIALVISMWDSDSYSTGQMVVITDKQMQEVLFNGTEQHCKFLFALETKFTDVYS